MRIAVERSGMVGGAAMRGAGDVKDASVETADSEMEADMTDGGGLTPFRIRGAHISRGLSSSSQNFVRRARSSFGHF